MFNPVFDEILELLHFDLNDDLVYIWVARAVAFLCKVTCKAVWVVSRHPIWRITVVLVNVLSQGIFDCQIHIGTRCTLQVELGDASLYF